MPKSSDCREAGGQPFLAERTRMLVEALAMAGFTLGVSAIMLWFGL